MIELGELLTVRVLPTGARADLAATGFMPLGRTWARRSARAGPKAQQRARGEGVHQPPWRGSRTPRIGAPAEQTGGTAR
jgi:hypothetical protein